MVDRTGIRSSARRRCRIDGSTESMSPTKPSSGSRAEATIRPASSPERPTASGAWMLIDDTMSRPTLPTRTIRAMSSVSASVTRRPSRNSDSLPSLAMSAPIWGPPPWTTTTRMPDRVHEDDVLGELHGEQGVGHGVAAVLHDDRRPPEASDVRQRLDEDRGLVRTRAHEVPMFSSTYAWVRSQVRTVARPAPRPRSAVISMSRCSMWAVTAATSWSTSTPWRQTTVSP